jgi:hypothetical protein
MTAFWLRFATALSRSVKLVRIEGSVVVATLVLLGLVVALAAAAAEIGSCACDIVVVVSSAGAVVGVPTAPPITTA